MTSLNFAVVRPVAYALGSVSDSSDVREAV
jgi:hypothetical protein